MAVVIHSGRAHGRGVVAVVIRSGRAHGRGVVAVVIRSGRAHGREVMWRQSFAVGGHTGER